MDIVIPGNPVQKVKPLEIACFFLFQNNKPSRNKAVNRHQNDQPPYDRRDHVLNSEIPSKIKYAVGVLTNIPPVCQIIEDGL